MHNSSPIVWLADLDTDAFETFGKHSRQLAKLTQAKFPLIPGFVITNQAYKNFLEQNNLQQKISQLLSTVSFDRADSLMQGEFHIQELFKRARLSDKFITSLEDYFSRIGKNGVTISVFETGPHEKKHLKHTADTIETLREKIIHSWAQLFTGKAMWQRNDRKLTYFQTGAEIIIQKNVRREKSGVIMTIDIATHEKDKLLLITHHPNEGDRYVLSKKNLTLLDRKLSHALNAPKLTHDEILAIAKMAKKVGEHHYFPQEIFWVLDDDTLFIEAIKPITEFAKPKSETKTKLPIARGKGITQRIATGTVHVLLPTLQNNKIGAHEIVVVSHLQTGSLSSFKHAKGIVIESALTSEEMKHKLKQIGIPTISNVKHASKLFKNSQIITIHGGKGEIYLGGFL